MTIFKRVKIPFIILFSLLTISVILGAFFLERRRENNLLVKRLQLSDKIFLSYFYEVTQKDTDKTKVNDTGGIIVDSTAFSELVKKIRSFIYTDVFKNVLGGDSDCFLVVENNNKFDLINRDNIENKSVLMKFTRNLISSKQDRLRRFVEVDGNRYLVLLHKFFDYRDKSNTYTLMFGSTIRVNPFYEVLQIAVLDSCFYLFIVIAAIVAVVLLFRRLLGWHFNKMISVFRDFGKDCFDKDIKKIEVFSSQHVKVLEELEQISKKLRNTLTEALIEKEKAMQALCCIGIAVIVLDKNSEIIQLNSFVEDMLEIKSEDVAGMKLNDIVDLKTLDNNDFDFSKVLEELY